MLYISFKLIINVFYFILVAPSQTIDSLKYPLQILNKILYAILFIFITHNSVVLFYQPRKIILKNFTTLVEVVKDINAQFSICELIRMKTKLFTKSKSIMSVEIITKEDLYAFKSELLTEIHKIIRPGKFEAPKQWLKSYEVRKMLNISPGTLQTLRINGTLRFTKIGGSLYYKYEDIINLLEGND